MYVVTLVPTIRTVHTLRIFRNASGTSLVGVDIACFACEMVGVIRMVGWVVVRNAGWSAWDIGLVRLHAGWLGFMLVNWLVCERVRRLVCWRKGF